MTKRIGAGLDDITMYGAVTQYNIDKPQFEIYMGCLRKFLCWADELGATEHLTNVSVIIEYGYARINGVKDKTRYSFFSSYYMCC